MSTTSSSLYEEGWCQGTVLGLELPTQSIALDINKGKPITRADVHGVWLIASQDCNLVRARPTSNAPSIELRQVLDEEPPALYGIRARKFLLDRERGHYLVDDKPVSTVSPRLLSFAGEDARLYGLSDDRVLALKTWLGNRYDRPAVPPDLGPIAKSVAAAIDVICHSDVAKTVRDVYMMFEHVNGSMHFSLCAIISDDADANDVREWLTTGALGVPVELGVPARLDVGTASEIPFEVVESWYCADLSQLTWGAQPGPDGAF